MRGVLLAVVIALSGCALDNARLQAIQAMDDESKDLLSKYRQFMTQLQMDRFLAKTTVDERKAYIASLKIEERIAHYPKHVQDAMWAREVIPGMDKAAVLLTWGSPSSREIDEAKLEVGVEHERWQYERGDHVYVVVVVNGVVTEVIEGKR